MSTHSLKKQLHALRSVGPSSSWQSAHRELLMQQIRSQSSLAVAPTLGARLRGWVSRVEMGFSSTVSLIASRSVTMALLVIALVLSSGGYLVAAADHSLPGDQLYNIKIAVEDARFAIARSSKN